MMFKVRMQAIFLFFILTPLLLLASGIEDATTYHANSNMQWYIAMDTIDLVPWKGDESVLDIGCGDGKITAYLSKKVTQGFVLGTDISSSMIDFASKHYPQQAYPNLAFQKLSATEIAFENQFDLVVSFSTFHWIKNQGDVFKAIYKALLPGGMICIHTYGKGCMNVTDMGDSLIHTEKWAPYFPSYIKQRFFFSEKDYSALLKEAGFNNIQITGSWNITIFKNRQALIDFARPILNFILHLPQDLQQEFVEEVADRIIALAFSDNGTIHYKTYNLRLLGEK